MVRTRLISLICVLCSMVLVPTPVRAGEPQPVVEVTYEQALALAREQGPALALARAESVAAEHQVDAARVWRTNPQIRAAAGPRFGADQTQVDVQVRAQQWLELGGQRGHRVEAARAELEASEAREEDAQRRLLRAVSLAFVDALYWRERASIAADNLSLATAAAEVARRRHELGDAGGLEASSAALAVAHAQLELDQARAALGQAEGELAALLGVEASTPVVAAGDLRSLALEGEPSEGEPELDARPDLRALEAEAREQRSRRALAEAERAPDLLVGVGYALEESEHVALGIAGLTLPVFNRGQGEAALAEAREASLEVELEVARTTAGVAIRTADSLVEQASAAALAFERDGLASLERTEEIVTVSYEKGAVAYDEVLVVRLALVAAKLDYADLLRVAANARVERAAARGGLQ